MQTLYYLILVPMVYLAVAVFILGIPTRMVMFWRRPKFAPTLQIYPEARPAWLYTLGDVFFLPTVRRHNPLLWVFLMLFHLGLFLLVIGHLELIADFKFLQIIPHEIFLGRGLVGLVMLIALIFFLFRRFLSPTKELSVPEDYFLLILIFLTVIFGSQMDWARSWFDFDTMQVNHYRAYLSSLLAFKPNISSVTSSGHSFMLVLHVFLANVLLMVFPFTKLMHAITTFPLNRIRRG